VSALEWTLFFGKFLLAFIPLGLIPVMIFLERKGAAVIQDRPGPNRAALKLPLLGQVRGFGFVHNFSDVVKLLFKEDFIPRRAHKWFYLAAPMIPVATAVLTPALIPWFAPLALNPQGPVISGAVIDANSSLLLLFALGSLSVYGVVLGSWGSNSKFSLLGGLRAPAMMIPSEVSMALGVLGLILIIGSFSLSDIVLWQSSHTWGVVVQPIGFMLFMVSMFAETGRTPFDVAEGESEIVGGFHTEYSSAKFALFFMCEYAHVVVASALLATLFFGGWSLLPLPGFGAGFITANLGYVIGVVALVKVALFVLLANLVNTQRRRYARFQASDREVKLKEYKLFGTLFWIVALVALVVAGIGFFVIGQPDALVQTNGSKVYHSGTGSHVYPTWVTLLSALVQLGIVLAKTLFFCWVFVWVRWTLPRLRYDQIMHLGWKVLLNIALVNLLATAVIAKLVQGSN
jgi:NADH-quinone oxidoreductase subunit H